MMSRWRDSRRERELNDEIEAHFRLAVEDRMRGGATLEQAVAAARREFGSDALVREVTREQWRGAWLTGMLREFGVALRTLRRSPRFTVVAALCIGVGIGVTMTMFTALHAILLRPLPYPNAAELVSIRATHATHVQHSRARVSQEWLESWRQAAATGEVGSWRSGTADLTGPEDMPERASSAAVTANLFQLLGVRPLHGRWFDEAEQTDGSGGVVILGHDLWRSRFGGDVGLIGSSIELDGAPRRVIGVMPPAFSFPDGAALWTPLGAPPLRDILYYDAALATLAPGATVTDARGQFDALTRALDEERGEPTGWTFTVATLSDELTSALRQPILIFQGAALLVLLLACANVATLMLARAAARRHELAVRAALGAGGGRLMAHVLIECVALACVGGVIAGVIAYAGVRTLALAFPDGVPSWIELTAHAPVLLLALLLTLLTALVFGLAPALRARREDGHGALTGAARAGDGHLHRSGRARNLLVAAEVAASVVLLAAAALLVRTHTALEQSLGFEHTGVLAIGIDLPRRQYGEQEQRILFHAQLTERLRALHGVDELSTSMTSTPLSEGASGGLWSFREDGAPVSTQAELSGRMIAMYHVTPGYLGVLGVPVLHGRDLSEEDRLAGEWTGVVNETFVNRYFTGRDVVGRRISTQYAPDRWSDPVRIVGVARDFRQAAPPAELEPALYMQQPLGPPRQTYMLQTRLANPLVLAPAVREIVRDLDPTLVVNRIQTQTAAVERTFWRQRLQRNVIAGFAGLAVLLALFGVYGVLSYAVAQRSAEFGVRLALGASARQLLFQVIGDAARMATIGIGIGLLAALALGRLLRGLLYGVEPTDPVILSGASVVLFLVAVCAALVPAWRASRLDPHSAIRGNG